MKFNRPLTWILILVVITGVGVALSTYFSKAPSYPNPGLGAACTEEAKVCSDGSYVGRTGPRCEFAACPGEQL